MAKAKAFTKDPALKKAMEKGGVISAPVISFVAETWQDTATIDTKLRSRTVFMVKDWEAWQKAFQEGKQERMDNGVLDRVIGHDADDNKKVMLVTAVTDTAKAFAYYKSDLLKKEISQRCGRRTRTVLISYRETLLIVMACVKNQR